MSKDYQEARIEILKARINVLDIEIEDLKKIMVSAFSKINKNFDLILRTRPNNKPQDLTHSDN